MPLAECAVLFAIGAMPLVALELVKASVKAWRGRGTHNAG